MPEYKRSGSFGGHRRSGGNFNRGNKRQNFGSGNRRDGGKRNGGRPQMFGAICDSCHKKCEVPFRPTGDKPVYCNDCFRTHRDNSPTNYRSDNYKNSSFPKPPVEDRRVDELKKQLDLVNMKLDKIMQIIEVKTEPVSLKKADKKTTTKKVAKTIKKLPGKNKFLNTQGRDK